MSERLRNIYHWCVNRLPEALLILCLLSAVPALVLGGLALLRQVQILAAGPAEYAEWFTANPWTVVSTFACIIAFVGLIGVLWRERAHLWPVARKMIVEALHRKVVLILLVFFVVLMPALPFILETQGSMKSQVQISFTYSLALAETLLCFVAILLGTASICREIEQQSIHITDAKPLPRWKLLAGKLAGIVIMCTALLFVMVLGVYGLVRYVSAQQDLSGLPKWKVRQAKRERMQVFNQVFTARTVINAPKPDVRERVEEKIQELKSNGKLEQQFGREDYARQQLTKRYQQQALSVPPRQMKMWVLKGLDPPRATDARAVYVRFKVFAPGTQQAGTVDGAWRLWVPRDQQKDGGKKAGGGGPKRREMVPARTIRRDWNTGSFQEFAVPVQAVTDKGRLHLSFQNLEPQATVIFELGQSVQAMQKVGSFFANFYRAVLVIMFHVILLAALGLMAGSMFSFPVASLVVGFIFLLGVSAPWFRALWQAVAVPFHFDAPWLTFIVNTGINSLMRFLLRVVPNVSTYSSIGKVVHGNLVSWSFVSRTGALMVVLKGGIVMLLATYAYYRRELARVIV